MYLIVEETLCREELGTYRTYGIRSGNGRMISDVSTKRGELSDFVEELNLLELDEIQLEDAVADFLAR